VPARQRDDHDDGAISRPSSSSSMGSASSRCKFPYGPKA